MTTRTARDALVRLRSRRPGPVGRAAGGRVLALSCAPGAGCLGAEGGDLAIHAGSTGDEPGAQPVGERCRGTRRVGDAWHQVRG